MPPSCFVKMMILATPSTTGCPSAPEYQIWWEYVHSQQSGVEISLWWNPKWRRRHLEFWLDIIFGHVILFILLLCTCTQNLSQFHPGRSYGYLPKSKMAAVCHFWIVMTSCKTSRGNIVSVWKFHSNKLLSFEAINIFIFPKWLGIA